MSKPRISYVDPATVKDQAMLAEFDRCRREGTPRPESQAIRAHVPAVFWSFANTWRDVFKNGVADHAIKELCRIYVSRSVKCEYCGNQRSMKAASQGIVEDDYRDLINFEGSTRYNEKQKAALSYAEAITWDLPVDDKFWARLHQHFSEPELVEIGYFVALTMGQQRWLRTLNIEHHQILRRHRAPRWRRASRMPTTLKRSKGAGDYWAKNVQRQRGRGVAGAGGDLNGRCVWRGEGRGGAGRLGVPRSRGIDREGLPPDPRGRPQRRARDRVSGRLHPGASGLVPPPFRDRRHLQPARHRAVQERGRNSRAGDRGAGRGRARRQCLCGDRRVREDAEHHRHHVQHARSISAPTAR